jgi:hypothetical protein
MSDPGEFSFKLTGIGHSKTADGAVNIDTHWEGTATGFGAVFGTLSVIRPMNSFDETTGSCSWVGQAFPEDGTVVGGIGQGTWKQEEGKHKWTISAEVEISNGDRLRSEGEIDLAARSYTGRLHPIE